MERKKRQKIRLIQVKKVQSGYLDHERNIGTRIPRNRDKEFETTCNLSGYPEPFYGYGPGVVVSKAKITTHHVVTMTSYSVVNNFVRG